MTRPADISAITFTAASERDVESGLLGWISFVISGLMRVDGVALRRTRAGRLALSWPSRRDRNGIDHPVLRPVNDGARRILEAAIFAALGITTEASPDGR